MHCHRLCASVLGLRTKRAAASLRTRAGEHGTSPEKRLNLCLGVSGAPWTDALGLPAYGDTLTRVCPSARQAISAGGPTNTAGDWSSCAIGRRFTENCWPARLASCSPPSCHVVYPHQRPNLHEAPWTRQQGCTVRRRRRPDTSADSTRYGHVTRYLTPRANST